jgi:hypothetical protein
MNQALYAHMNNKRKMKKTKKRNYMYMFFLPYFDDQNVSLAGTQAMSCTIR